MYLVSDAAALCRSAEIQPGDMVDKAFFEPITGGEEDSKIDFDLGWIAQELEKLPSAKRRRIQNVVGEIISLM